jgi:NADH-quinone oxidoreductase subunit M
MASVGLPGTAGFLSEFLVLLGAFRSHPIAALIAATGVIFAAYYMLPMVQRTVFNALDRPANRHVPDLNAREILVLAPLVLLILWLGVYPKPVLDKMRPAAERLAHGMETARAAYVALPPSVGEVAASPR